MLPLHSSKTGRWIGSLLVLLTITPFLAAADPASPARTDADFDLIDLSGAPRAARKSADLKATSQLVDASRSAQNGFEAQRSLNLQVNDQKEVLVDIATPSGTPPVSEALLGQHAVRVTNRWREHVEAWVPLAEVEALARSLPDGSIMEPVGVRMESLDTEGQGPGLMNSNAYRDLGFDGSGITIAVIDIGYAGLLTSVATGDAPNGATLYNYTADSFYAVSDGSHGRFVMETIFDHAPGATYLIMKVDGQTDVATAVDDAIADGANIISMSLGWWPNWEDNSDTAAIAFNEAGSAGILAFNSAGNSADDHYEGSFDDNDGDDWHNWVGTDDEAMGIFVAPGATFSARLSWDRSGGTHDYDLYLFNVDGTVTLDSSTASGETYEQVSVTNNNPFQIIVHLAATRESGGGTDLEIYSGGGTYQQFLTPSGSILTPSNATHSLAISVGAVEQVSYGSAKYTNGITAIYSSQGPTNDGSFAPDVCAPTSTSGSFFGSFTGTSCACPHAAGVTACAWSVNPAGTPYQVRNQMYAWANDKDWGNAGADYVYGRGGINFPLHADCNSNGWPDAFDIASGSSDDDNQNGRPDECDVPGGMSFGWLGFGGSTPVNPLDGIGSFQVVGMIQPGAPDPSNPLPLVSGFRMAIAYDRLALDILSVEPSPALVEFLGAPPASFDFTDVGTGIIIECTFGMDAAGSPLLYAVQVAFEAIVIQGTTDAVSSPSLIGPTELLFSNDIPGVPTATNELLSGTVSFPIPTIDLGGTTIVPTATPTLVYSLNAEEEDELFVSYNPADPEASFELPFNVRTQFGTPRELSGLAASIRHNSALLAATGAVPAGPIADRGPEIWLVEVSANGLSLLAEWSTTDPVLFTIDGAPAAVASIAYEATAAGLFGDLDGVTTMVGFNDQIGIATAANLAFTTEGDETPQTESALIHFVPESTAPALFRRGDVDQDGLVNVGDAIQLLGYLFQGAADPACEDGADVDDNGSLSIGDAVNLLSYLFAGGAPPAAPGPLACGVDLTEDTLTCLQGCP